MLPAAAGAVHAHLPGRISNAAALGYAGAMFEGWGDFFLMAGSAAAVLIGLIFVVMTLMQDRSRSSVLEGSKLYMGPVVLHMSFVLVISGTALVPAITPDAFTVVACAVAVWGLVRGAMVTMGIRRLAFSDDAPHWTDMWFYGAIPTALYVALAVAALAIAGGRAWAGDAFAAVIVGLLLLGIRNEWDLVTWLAPRPDGEDGHEH